MGGERVSGRSIACGESASLGARARKGRSERTCERGPNAAEMREKERERERRGNGKKRKECDRQRATGKEAPSGDWSADSTRRGQGRASGKRGRRGRAATGGRGPTAVAFPLPPLRCASEGRGVGGKRGARRREGGEARVRSWWRWWRWWRLCCHAMWTTYRKRKRGVEWRESRATRTVSTSGSSGIRPRGLGNAVGCAPQTRWGAAGVSKESGRKEAERRRGRVIGEASERSSRRDVASLRLRISGQRTEGIYRRALGSGQRHKKTSLRVRCARRRGMRMKRGVEAGAGRGAEAAGVRLMGWQGWMGWGLKRRSLARFASLSGCKMRTTRIMFMTCTRQVDARDVPRMQSASVRSSLRRRCSFPSRRR